MNTSLSRRNFIGGALCFGAAYPLVGAAASDGANLVIGIVSDPHTTSPANLEYFRKALMYFRERGVDAVAIPGDFGNIAEHGELLRAASAWFDVFPDDRMPDGRRIERFFVTGNHDEDGWRYANAKYRFRGASPEKKAFAFNRQAFWREAWHEDYAPMFTKEIKGYRFIGRNWLPGKDYSKNPAPGWLRAHMDLLPKDRPFFYLQHEALTGATRHALAGQIIKGKVWDGADDGVVASFLAEYPNCIGLTGHTHNPLSFDTGIWQGAFTTVDCGTTCSWPFTAPGHENGHPNGREMPMIDRRTERHALVMSVFDDRIVFERRCLLNDEPLGADWVVPFEGGRPYTDAGRNAAEAVPEFASAAKATVRREIGPDAKGVRHEQIVVTFPSVNGTAAPYVRAFDYEIISSPAGKRPYRVFSPACCLAPGRDGGLVVCRMNAADFAKDVPLSFTIRPCDSRGRAGRGLKVEG